MTDTPNASSDSPCQEEPASNLAVPDDLLADLSVEERAELIQLVSQIEVYGSFSGPLPPPNVLNLYDAEARQAIISGFVANGHHRRTSESRGQLLFFMRDILALSAAFILALVLVTGSIDSIQQGQSIEGLLGIGGAVAVIAGAFLRERHRRRDQFGGDALSPNTSEGESDAN